MSSGRALDHVVLAVRHLAGTASQYEALGFTLTPLAHHQDSMGTCNRLVQFEQKNFIELLEVDRPHSIVPPDASQFSFGTFIRDWVKQREGIAMLVFATQDAAADKAAFAAAGVDTYEPFHFERQATLPGGEQVTVGFSLAFATSKHMPNLAFFACHNRYPQHFWKPAFQSHANGATGIGAVQLVSPEPARDAAFVSSLFGGTVDEGKDALRVACDRQAVEVLTPDAMRARDATFAWTPDVGAVFAGMTLAGNASGARATTPAAQAAGTTLGWS